MNEVLFGLLLFLYFFETTASREWFYYIQSCFSAYDIVLNEEDERNVQKNRSIGIVEFNIDNRGNPVHGEIPKSMGLNSGISSLLLSKNASSCNGNTDEDFSKVSISEAMDLIIPSSVVSNISQVSLVTSTESVVALNVSQTVASSSYVSQVSTVSWNEATSSLITSSMPQSTSVPINETRTSTGISCNSVVSVASNTSMECLRHSDTIQKAAVVSSMVPQSFIVANKSLVSTTSTSLLSSDSPNSSNPFSSSNIRLHSTVSSVFSNRYQTETLTRLWSEAQSFDLPLRNLFNMTYLLKKFLPLTVSSHVLAPDSESLLSIVKNHKRHLVQKCHGHDIYSFCQGHSLLSWDSDSRYFYTFSPQPLPQNHSSSQLTFVAHTS